MSPTQTHPEYSTYGISPNPGPGTSSKYINTNKTMMRNEKKEEKKEKKKRKMSVRSEAPSDRKKRTKINTQSH